MRRVSGELRREIRAWAFLYEDAQPDCFLPPRIDATTGFEEHLEAVRALSPDDARYELARPLFHYHVPDRAGASGSTTRTSDSGSWSGPRARPEAASSPHASSTIRRPRSSVWPRCWSATWSEAFAAESARLEPELEAAVDECRGAIAGRGAFELPGSRPGLFREGAVIVRRSPHEHTFEIGPGRRLMLVPSAYVWPHSRVNCDDPWPLAVIHPAPFVLPRSRTPSGAARAGGIASCRGRPDAPRHPPALRRAAADDG